MKNFTLFTSNALHKYLALFVLLLTVNVGWGQASTANYTSTSSSAWYTAANWSTGSWAGTKSAATSDTSVATFLSTTISTVGINMGTSSLSLGAISIDSGRSTANNLGNSSATAGTLALYGATVNSVPNVIVRNAGTGLFTLQAAQNGIMGVILKNATDNIINIDGSGGITISPIISGTGNLRKGGSGAGVLTLTGVNTFTGNTIISAGTLALSTAGAIATSPNITIGSGGTFDVSGLTTALTLASTQTLKSSATGGITTGTISVLSGKGLTLSTGGLVFTAYAGGSTAPLTVTGASAGALALASAPITVTTTTALTAGTYKLIAKGGSATGVSGTIGTLTLGGLGLDSGTTGALSIVSGELILTVTSTSTPSLAVTGTAAHGSSCVNTAATTIQYTITNTGTAASNVVVSSNDAQFVVSGLSSTSIAATTGTATYNVTFTPTTSGAKSATITVYYSTNTSATTSSLTGTGVASVTPVIASSAATSVTAQLATLNGSVTTLGACPTTTSKGFVYSKSTDSTDPTNGGTNVTTTSVSSLVTGAYTLPLTGLSSSTTYYFKAYLFDGTTYTYGTVQSFTTLPALVLSGTLSNGTVCPNVAATAVTYTITNNSNVSVAGVSAVSSDSQFVTSAVSPTTITAGSTGTYTVTFTPTGAGAQSSTVTVSSATSGIVSVSNTPTGTGATAVTQAVSSSAAASVSYTTATLNGNYTTSGVCPATTEKGFVYSLTSVNNNPLVSGTGVTKSTVTLGSTGTYLLALSSLTSGSGYSFKAYVYNGTTYTYGSVLTFNTTTTTAPGAPTIGTATAGNTTASVAFTAPVSNGGSAITGYTVTSDPSGGVDINSGSTTLSHTVANLNGEQEYTFTVTATNPLGSTPKNDCNTKKLMIIIGAKRNIKYSTLKILY